MCEGLGFVTCSVWAGSLAWATDSRGWLARARRAGHTRGVKRIGDYVFEHELARGGMGVVYRGQGPHGPVAIKVVLEQDPALKARVRQELDSLRRLDHPGIVRLHTLLDDGQGHDALVMELVEGESLHARLRRDGPLPLPVALDLARQLCAAVAHAHARQVLHRDLKPENVLLTHAGQVKLTDFGLGKVVPDHGETQRGLTKTGELLGTPHYMAPEQAAGERTQVGAAADVYGLGSTLFAMLTGQPPFEGPTVLNVLNAVLHDPAPRPSSLRPDVPAWLDEVVACCLAKEPGDRYRSAEALAEALADGAPKAPRERRAAALAATLVTSAAVGAAALIWLRPAHPAASSPPTAASSPPPTAASSRPPTAASSPASVVASPGNPAEAGVDAWITAGRQRLRAGDAAEALEAFDTAVARDPDSARAWIGRGFVLAKLGRAAEGVRAYDEAIRLDPSNATAFYNRGATRVNMGDLAAAELDLRRARELDPGLFPGIDKLLENVTWARQTGWQSLPSSSVINAQRRAALAMEAGKFEEAEHLIETVVAVDDDDSGVWLARANLAFDRGRLDDALRHVNRAVECDPDGIEPRLARSRLSFRLGEPDAAWRDLDALQARHPRDRRVLLRRAGLLREQGDLDEAWAAVEALLAELDASADDAPGLGVQLGHGTPISRSARLLHATLRLDRDDLPGAIVELRAVIDDAPGVPELRLQLAAWWIMARQPELAEDELTVLESLEDTSPTQRDDAKVLRARARVVGGEPEQALRALQPLPAAGPQRVSARGWRARALRLAGRPDEALVEAEALLRDVPGDSFAAFERVEAWALLGRMPEALAEVDALLAAGVDPVRARLTRARLRWIHGRRAEALDDLRPLTHPNQVRARTWLGALTGEAPPPIGPRGPGWSLAQDRFVAGELSEAELLAAAESVEAGVVRRTYTCEAHHLLALRCDAQGDAAGARAHFEACLETRAMAELSYWWAALALSAR